jgi:hypothetical protein
MSLRAGVHNKATGASAVNLSGASYSFGSDQATVTWGATASPTNYVNVYMSINGINGTYILFAPMVLATLGTAVISTASAPLNTTVFFKAKGANSDGVESAFGLGTSCVKASGPSAPTLLSANWDFASDQVFVTWNTPAPVADVSLNLYYSAVGATGPWTQLTTGIDPTAGSIGVDTSILGHSKWWMMRGVDALAAESGNSNVVFG